MSSKQEGLLEGPRGCRGRHKVNAVDLLPFFTSSNSYSFVLIWFAKSNNSNYNLLNTQDPKCFACIISSFFEIIPGVKHDYPTLPLGRLRLRDME